jgi:hypothetical protein
MQVTMFAQFIKNPHVKLLDQYKNKSHGENVDSLFRFSFDKDFNTTAVLKWIKHKYPLYIQGLKAHPSLSSECCIIEGLEEELRPW